MTTIIFSLRSFSSTEPYKNLSNWFSKQEIRNKRKTIKDIVLELKRQQQKHEKVESPVEVEDQKSEGFLRMTNDGIYNQWLGEMTKAEFHFFRGYSNGEEQQDESSDNLEDLLRDSIIERGSYDIASNESLVPATNPSVKDLLDEKCLNEKHGELDNLTQATCVVSEAKQKGNFSPPRSQVKLSAKHFPEIITDRLKKPKPVPNDKSEPNIWENRLRTSKNVVGCSNTRLPDKCRLPIKRR